MTQASTATHLQSPVPPLDAMVGVCLTVVRLLGFIVPTPIRSDFILGIEDLLNGSRASAATKQTLFSDVAARAPLLNSHNCAMGQDQRLVFRHFE